jgi:serine/threonine protein kinase
LRPFIEEGLERLDGVRYVIELGGYPSERYVRDPATKTLIDTENPREAIEKWVAILSSEHDQELACCSYKIRVPRSSVIRFIVDVVDDVAEMHDRQKIHGDIKPSNTLISRNGKTLIDEGNLGVGDISPTVTLGWSPSEQLLRQPLSCAADIFPLGQMLLHVLDGELLGKEVCYRLPGAKKVTLIEDPTVYIRDERIPPSTRNQWCRLIERALRTDPQQRWPDARVMGEEVRRLADQKDVPGFVDLTFPWGPQPSLIDEGKGTLTVGWMMHTQGLAMSW